MLDAAPGRREVGTSTRGYGLDVDGIPLSPSSPRRLEHGVAFLNRNEYFMINGHSFLIRTALPTLFRSALLC